MLRWLSPRNFDFLHEQNRGCPQETGKIYQTGESHPHLPNVESKDGTRNRGRTPPTRKVLICRLATALTPQAWLIFLLPLSKNASFVRHFYGDALIIELHD